MSDRTPEEYAAEAEAHRAYRNVFIKTNVVSGDARTVLEDMAHFARIRVHGHTGNADRILGRQEMFNWVMNRIGRPVEDILIFERIARKAKEIE